jgi:hypothetical protein
LKLRLTNQHRCEHVWCRFSLERLSSRQHLVKDDAEREHVAAVIGDEPLRLLRRHVCRGAEDDARAGRHHAQRGRIRHVRDRFGIHRLGQTEVEQLDLVLRRDLDVCRFQIAMDDASVVRRFERLRDLQRDSERILDRKRPALQPVRERFAFDQLHDQEVLAIELLHSVQSCDTRVVDRGEDLRFALESRDAIGVGSEGFQNGLDGDAAAEPAVARAVHFAHAADSEHMRDLVRAESGARRQWHGRAGLYPQNQHALLRGNLT